MAGQDVMLERPEQAFVAGLQRSNTRRCDVPQDIVPPAVLSIAGLSISIAVCTSAYANVSLFLVLLLAG